MYPEELGEKAGEVGKSVSFGVKSMLNTLHELFKFRFESNTFYGLSSMIFALWNLLKMSDSCLLYNPKDRTRSGR